MLRRTLLSALLAVLVGCDDRLIGDASEDAGSDQGQSHGGGSQEEIERLIAASAALNGEWRSPDNPFEAFGGPPNVSMKLTPRAGTTRGTFRATCPQRCRIFFSEERDAAVDLQPGPIEISNGEYELVGFTRQGLIRGLLYSDESVFGLTFSMASAGAPLPNTIVVDAVGLTIPMERTAPGP